MVTRYHRPHTGDGWRLELKQLHDPDRLDPAKRPVAIVPGYGMNSFIFGFHPNGPSLEEYLTQAGFEVWSLNLRGQGGARMLNGSKDYGFRELSLVDLPRALGIIREETRTDAEQIDIIGCSLGATVMYAYMAHHSEDALPGSLVSIGGPLRWEEIHPAVKLAFSSAFIAGSVPIKGTRVLARSILPVLKKFPPLLSFYMNANIVDLSYADELVKTVDDPNPYLNRQIAHWIREKDLEVADINITVGMRKVDRPLLVILANRDGVVTPEAALSVRDAIGTDNVDVLKVGDEETWFAHADLFISRYAQKQVFQPLVEWLEGQYG